MTKLSKDTVLARGRLYENEDVSRSYAHLVIAFAIWVTAYCTILWSPSALLNGLGVITAAAVTIRIFIMYHDYCHGAIFKSKGAFVDLLLRAYGILIFFPSKQWTSSHNEHHANNSVLNMGGSPICRNYLDGYFAVVDTDVWKRYSRRERFLYRFRRSPIAVACGLVTFFILPTLLKGIKYPLGNFESWVSLATHLILSGTLIANFGVGVWLSVYASLFVATALGSYLFYAQHNFPEAEYDDKQDWDFVESSVNATSHFMMNPLMAWVTGNIGYHHIHHINCKIPFYRLAEAHAELGKYINVKSTTWKARDVANNFRCNLWDRSKGRFVSYNEIQA